MLHTSLCSSVCDIEKNISSRYFRNSDAKAAEFLKYIERNVKIRYFISDKYMSISDQKYGEIKGKKAYYY